VEDVVDHVSSNKDGHVEMQLCTTGVPTPVHVGVGRTAVAGSGSGPLRMDACGGS
jgi:hypothetical protein